MSALFIGDKQATAEMQLKLGNNRPIQYLRAEEEIFDFSPYDVIIDTRFESLTEPFSYWEISNNYSHLENKLVLLGMVRGQLSALHWYWTSPPACHFVAFNSLPTFINRPLWEMSVLREETKDVLSQRLKTLGIDYRLVDDRVGMVMPRIICMIINEAFYTLQEGTATEADIDLSMKLGVNYPYGPFEWLEKIGIEHVYRLLQDLYNDTHDERYKICPLLKSRYYMAKKHD